jgi:hypothetical protein
MGPGTAQVTLGPTAADENKTLEEAHVRCTVVGIDVKAINLRDAATDWRGSSQGLAALRDSGPVKDRNGSWLCENEI